jgi:heme exporter protein CcmD
MSIFETRHFFFVASAYGLSFLLLAGLALWIYFAYQSKKKQLLRLEAQSKQADK